MAVITIPANTVYPFAVPADWRCTSPYEISNDGYRYAILYFEKMLGTQVTRYYPLGYDLQPEDDFTLVSGEYGMSFCPGDVVTINNISSQDIHLDYPASLPPPPDSVDPDSLPWVYIAIAGVVGVSVLAFLFLRR